VHPYGNSDKLMSPFRLTKEIPSGSEAFEVIYPMGDDCLLWDEFSPNLYTMKVGLSMKKTRDVQSSSILFGMREFQG
jgi:hypothetical protein